MWINYLIKCFPSDNNSTYHHKLGKCTDNCEKIGYDSIISNCIEFSLKLTMASSETIQKRILHPPPISPSTSPMSKYDPKPTNITLRESPHEIHGPKQGNPFPNSKTKSQPLHNKTTDLENDPPTPPEAPLDFSHVQTRPQTTKHHPIQKLSQEPRPKNRGKPPQIPKLSPF